MRRMSRALVVAAALLGAVACGVVVDIRDGADGGGPNVNPEGGNPSDDGGEDEGGNNGDDSGPPPDAGLQVVAIGDASVLVTSVVNLVADGGPQTVNVALRTEGGDPSTLDSASVTVNDSSVLVKQVGAGPNIRTFELVALGDAVPHRPATSVTAAVGGSSLSTDIEVRIARYFRTGGDTELAIPLDTPPTNYEVVLWGAGGGSSASAQGGAGSYARGTLTGFSGPLTVRVGEAGNRGGSPGGGSGGTSSGNGGGYSALFTSSIANANDTTALVVAGAGGGAGMFSAGGGGDQRGVGVQGGSMGTNNGAGQPGGPNATAGNKLAGGTGSTIDQTGGGGGAGWFGGGGGAAGCGGGGGFSKQRNGAGISSTFLPGKLTVPGNVGHYLRQNAGDTQAAGAILITPN